MAEMPRRSPNKVTDAFGRARAARAENSSPQFVAVVPSQRIVGPQQSAVASNVRAVALKVTAALAADHPIAVRAAAVEQVHKQTEAEKVVATITAQAQAVRDQSTALTAKIVAFEDWLNTLPGRVITYCWIDAAEGPGDDSAVVLRLRRQGKRWIIEHADGNMRDDQTGEFSPLVEADIETKIFAVNHFPKLLGDIAKAQNNRIEQLKKCSSGFDEFAAALGIETGGK